MKERGEIKVTTTDAWQLCTVNVIYRLRFNQILNVTKDYVLWAAGEETAHPGL